MLLYKFGKIPYIGKNYIILENNGNGFQINVANSKRFRLGENTKLFIHEYQYENQVKYYGFRRYKERLLFSDLLMINGIGPKIAMILLQDDYETIARLIALEKSQEISAYPYCSERIARNIVFELSRKWKTILIKENLLNLDQEVNKEPTLAKDFSQSLKVLGYKHKQIEYAIENVPEDDLEIMIQNAIKLLAENREFKS